MCRNAEGGGRRAGGDGQSGLDPAHHVQRAGAGADGRSGLPRLLHGPAPGRPAAPARGGRPVRRRRRELRQRRRRRRRLRLDQRRADAVRRRRRDASCTATGPRATSRSWDGAARPTSAWWRRPAPSEMFLYGVDAFALARGARNEAGARAFLETVASPAGQVAFNRHQGLEPDPSRRPARRAGSARPRDARRPRAREDPDAGAQPPGLGGGAGRRSRATTIATSCCAPSSTRRRPSETRSARSALALAGSCSGACPAPTPDRRRGCRPPRRPGKELGQDLQRAPVVRIVERRDQHGVRCRCRSWRSWPAAARRRAAAAPASAAR